MRLELYDSKELNFVELNITGGNDSYIRCDKESKYIDSIVFNLFTPCFEQANKLYEYYGPTKYNSRKLIPLRNELLKFRDALASTQNSEELSELVGGHFLGQEFLEEIESKRPGWQDNHEYVRDKLVSIAVDIIKLTELCAFEEKILWVIGY